MSTFVFLGRTMPRTEAARVLAARYLPPAAAGDVVALIPKRPRAIAIIDGVTETAPSVWPDEILAALHAGIPVVGGAAEGALYAAGLHSQGMVGVGEVFRLYAERALRDDSAVAVALEPRGRGAVARSVSLVNIEHALAQAQAAGAITPRTRATLGALARNTWYVERTWATLAARAVEQGITHAELAALATYVRRARPDLQRDDARSVLRWLGQRSLPVPAPPPVRVGQRLADLLAEDVPFAPAPRVRPRHGLWASDLNAAVDGDRERGSLFRESHRLHALAADAADAGLIDSSTLELLRIAAEDTRSARRRVLALEDAVRGVYRAAIAAAVPAAARTTDAMARLADASDARHAAARATPRAGKRPPRPRSKR